MARWRAGRDFVLLVWRRDMSKPCSCQICRRAAARVSLNVGRCFSIPRCCRHTPSLGRVELTCEQGHDGKQRKQARRGSSDGQVRPLTLGLDAKMGSGFLERDLDLPALHEPAQDLLRRAGEAGAQQSLRLEPAERIAHQHPADRHDWQAGVTPHGGGRAELDDAFTHAIPSGHHHLLPPCVKAGQDVGQVRQTSPPPVAPPPAASQTDRQEAMVRGRPLVPGCRGAAGS